jgi:hypothetical protein
MKRRKKKKGRVEGLEIRFLGTHLGAASPPLSPSKINASLFGLKRLDVPYFKRIKG